MEATPNLKQSPCVVNALHLRAVLVRRTSPPMHDELSLIQKHQHDPQTSDPPPR
jgi:hypothetical protein